MRRISHSEYEQTKVRIVLGEEILIEIDDCFVVPALGEIILHHDKMYKIINVVIQYVADNKTTITCFVQLGGL